MTDRRPRRGGAVLAATAAAPLVWLVADPLLGREPRISEGQGADERVLEIGPVAVVAGSLAAGLAGWGLLAVLERCTRRARGIWLAVAGVVLALSFLPLTGSGMSGSTRMALAWTHLAVAAVLVPGLAGRRVRAGARS
ncbi:DUF6069 family protein [Streptomyces profundus]|uniref:DUF6069 family protein n=1 Tax=Streptomyces profundus TaxID=2867410 RepID=UPI001D163C34|nr:DUF6069 family protein [Streptomyces sp. MA3_2.13]UED84269.1 DUF6069 family protein [Streptomyces sp. MA3_2.13]